MFKITKQNGDSFLAEKIEYVRKIGERTFIRTDKDRAEGVGHSGVFYMFSDGCYISEIDAADEFRRLEAENRVIKEQLAATEDALCEMDSINEERIAAIEDALCEIDMGGNV